MKRFFSLATCLFCAISAFSQMGMGGMGMRSMNQQPMQQQSSEKPPSPEEQLDKSMARLTSELELNGLQEAAIRNILKEQQVQFTALRADKRPESEKTDEARILSEKTDHDIKALLDPGQVDKYMQFKDDLRSGKKKKKKKEKTDEEIHE